jgi:hypothetical protein
VRSERDSGASASKERSWWSETGTDATIDATTDATIDGTIDARACP